MFTQCPECATVYALSPDDLKAASGFVRCGSCDTTFNALDALRDTPPPFKPRPQLASQAGPAAGSAGDDTRAPAAGGDAATAAGPTGAAAEPASEEVPESAAHGNTDTAQEDPAGNTPFDPDESSPDLHSERAVEDLADKAAEDSRAAADADAHDAADDDDDADVDPDDDPYGDTQVLDSQWADELPADDGNDDAADSEEWFEPEPLGVDPERTTRMVAPEELDRARGSDGQADAQRGERASAASDAQQSDAEAVDGGAPTDKRAPARGRSESDPAPDTSGDGTRADHQRRQDGPADDPADSATARARSDAPALSRDDTDHSEHADTDQANKAKAAGPDAALGRDGEDDSGAGHTSHTSEFGFRDVLFSDEILGIGTVTAAHRDGDAERTGSATAWADDPSRSAQGTGATDTGGDADPERLPRPAVGTKDAGEYDGADGQSDSRSATDSAAGATRRDDAARQGDDSSPDTADAAGKPPPAAATRADDNKPAAGQFVDDAQDRRDILDYLRPGLTPVQKIAGTITAVLLLAVLGVQAVHHWRTVLVRDARVGDLVQRVYGALGQTVLPAASFRDYEVARHTIVLRDDQTTVYQLRATVVNRADGRRPYPLLRVTFFDRFGDENLVRTFTVDDYLHGTEISDPLLESNAGFEAALDLVNVGAESSSNYFVEVCAPMPGGDASCAAPNRDVRARR